MKQPEQSYTAIETADGFLFFTHTAEGQASMQKFLQLVADHYFDPHFNLGPVSVYRAEGILRHGYSVNPGENLFTEYPYLKMNRTPEMELAYRNEMKPTSEDFGSFCHNAHCEISHRNCNIIDALDAIAGKERPPPAGAGSGTCTLSASRSKGQPIPFLCMGERGFFPDRIL